MRGLLVGVSARTLALFAGGAVLVGVVAFLALTFIHGEATLGKGTVVGKIDTPAYDDTWLMPVYTGQTCIRSGSGASASNICTPNYTYVPMPQHHSETWKLKIEAKNEDTGKVKHGVWYVSQEVYGQVKIGDYFDKDMGGVTKEPGVVREGGG